MIGYEGATIRRDTAPLDNPSVDTRISLMATVVIVAVTGTESGGGGGVTVT